MQICFRNEELCASAKDASELILLAPASGAGLAAFDSSKFGRVSCDRSRRRELLSAMQRFRGRIAVEEGAVKPAQLTADGRHEMEEDHNAWHLILQKNQSVIGCIRYVCYWPTVRATDLLVWRGALARSAEWSFSLRAAVEQQLAYARRKAVLFSEPGGWVVDKQWRGVTEAIRLALGGFALASLLGGAVGVYTATRKHQSAAMLRRLGGSPLAFGGVTLPSYYEPHYDCEIEILRFDTSRVKTAYTTVVDELRDRMAEVCTVLAPQPQPIAVTQAYPSSAYLAMEAAQ